MATRRALLEAREQLRTQIIAAEGWQPSYQKDSRTFRLLVQGEARLETQVAEYLASASKRASDYVDWTRLPDPVQADQGPVDNNDAASWQIEEILLTQAVLEVMTELAATGAVAGEAIYGIPAGFDDVPSASLDDAIMSAARNHVAQLVSGVTDTTRQLVRESVAQSIALGETKEQSIERLSKVINNPVRAELIAKTESVNSYQLGLAHYAMATGAKTKEWDGLQGACVTCTSLIGKTVNVDESFELPDGTLVDHPSIHPGDRCGVIYNY